MAWTRRCTSLVAMTVVVMDLVSTVRAADGAPGALSTTSLNGLSPDNIGSIVVTTLQGGLPVGSRRLVVMQDLPDVAATNAPRICNGTPAIVAHTPALGGNGECWKRSIMPTLNSNLSCTCLNYLNATPEEWTITFKMLKSTEQVQLLPSLDTAEIVEVDSSMIYGVAPSVKTLNLIGIGDTPVPIQLRKSPIPGTVTNDFALIISTSTATIQTLRVENVDFSTYELQRGFVPSRLSNLTMKNCKLSGFPTDLLANMGKLEYLDLSNNDLMGIYQDITKDTCVAALCPIKAMNLSYNNIKTIPSYLLNMDNLESLSLRNNKISNFSIGSDVYASLQRLKVLELDRIDSCSTGEPKIAATANVCVYNATISTPDSAPPVTDPSSGSSSSLMYVVIGGCLVIAILVFVLVKKKSCRSDDDTFNSKEPLDAYFDNTIAFDETHATVSASLLNDPIIITHRIPYNDIRVANCISKGGFGLVYSGVYNRRRVAIKKIRPDRAGDIKQIESFLKEICLMATLNHPRVVEFIGVSWDSLRNLCAVTEFMERGDLREVLHGFKLRNTPLTWEANKTAIALHIAEGLTYLHSLSPMVVHRDLKSKNILLDGEMTAKLSDFGISRERNIEETHFMTAGIGTSFWIAPEVLLGKDYDEHADIFSFGVVLSEIDTDDYPYWNAANPNVGNKAQENMILQMVASGAMRPSFSDSCPPAIMELADMCLQVEPENRPTAAEVAYKLQQIVQFMRPPSSSSGGARAAV